jgi:hypothetical protein
MSDTLHILQPSTLAIYLVKSATREKVLPDSIWRQAVLAATAKPPRFE